MFFVNASVICTQLLQIRHALLPHFISSKSVIHGSFQLSRRQGISFKTAIGEFCAAPLYISKVHKSIPQGMNLPVARSSQEAAVVSTSFHNSISHRKGRYSPIITDGGSISVHLGS